MLPSGVKMVRDKPDSSLLYVRNKALLWEMEDSRFHHPRAVKSNQVKSEVSETQCCPVTTDKGQCTVLDDFQRAVAYQEKQLAELSKMISELAGAVINWISAALNRCSQDPSHELGNSQSSHQMASLSVSNEEVLGTLPEGAHRHKGGKAPQHQVPL